MTIRINKIQDKIDSLENKVTHLRVKPIRTKNNHKIRVSSANTVKYDSSNDFNTTHIQETDYLSNNNNIKQIYSNNINSDEINSLKKDDSASLNLWKKILSQIRIQNINSAYETVLNSGIRLINQMMIYTYSGYCS